MKLNQIVAHDKNFGIGKNNQLLWHYPEDLQHFKKLTSQKIIIMGRKTYDSIFSLKQKPLPNRHHIVISKSKLFTNSENVTFVNSVDESYLEAEKLILDKKYPEDVFIIGGSQIYQQTLNNCQHLYITQVNQQFEADTFYPKNYSQFFSKVSSLKSELAPDLSFEFWNKIN